MGLVAVLKSFTRVSRKGANITDVKCDPGGKPLGTYDHFSAPGDDSFPLVDDYVAAISTPHTGRNVAVGYMDVVNTPKSTEGDKRIYARDVDGVAVCEVWLKRDETITINNSECDATLEPTGEIKLSNALGAYTLAPTGQTTINNALGSITLLPTGVINLNGVTIDPLGNVTLPPAATILTQSIFVDGKEIKDHIHLAGTPPGNTGPNV